MKVFGVTLTNSLSVAEHVQAVISSCAQTLYALRILRAHGMDDSDLQTVYRSVVIAKLTYASDAWLGATDRQRLDAFIRRSERITLFRQTSRRLLNCVVQQMTDCSTRSSLTKQMCSTIFFHRHQWRLRTTIYASEDIT